MYPHVNFEDRTIEGPLLNLFSNGTGSVLVKLGTFHWFESLIATLSLIWNIYSFFAFAISALFFIGFIYAKKRTAQLGSMVEAKIHEEERAWSEKFEGKILENQKWLDIQKHLGENNPISWRIAIIEADILLDDTLTHAGYTGSTIAEKLKSANRNAFTTVEDAWKAHKVRNQIAHEGSDFILTKKIAQETIVHFERVFREFKII